MVKSNHLSTGPAVTYWSVGLGHLLKPASLWGSMRMSWDDACKILEYDVELWSMTPGSQARKCSTSSAMIKLLKMGLLGCVQGRRDGISVDFLFKKQTNKQVFVYFHPAGILEASLDLSLH